MGITPNFDFKSLEGYMQGKKEVLDQLILRNLNYLGLKCVSVARSLNTYTDRTGNLRNSIGYLVLKEGIIQDTFFEAENRGPEYKAGELPGERVGEDFAKKLAEEFTEGYILVVVAGMEYASYVEDVHHLDVLQPAETMAEIEIDQIVESILKSMKKAS